jgi:LAO/AO transport system kinase
MSRGPPLPPAARAIVRGDRQALARAISAIEDGDPTIEPVLRALYPRKHHAPVVGLAGPLGVGKSSLVNALVGYLRGMGRTVGIVAVDPSSPFSGGSVLGDRIRLERRAGDRGVYFRSMASRGAAGGLAAVTREVTRLLDRAGFDVVLVETVGSGQVDVAVREVASTGVVVLVPHLGDEVQTLKAGLFEIADVFCLNKADLPGAQVAERDLSELAALGPTRDGWRPPVVATSTVTPSGIPELWRAIERHERFLDESGQRAIGERRRMGAEIVGRARDRLTAELTERLETDPELRALLDRVESGSLDPRTAVGELLRSRRAARR